MKKIFKTLFTISLITLLSGFILVSCGKKNKTDDDIPEDDDPIVETKTDIVGVTFDDVAFAYDGNPHSLVIGGTALPEGVNVSYTNNGQIEVGEYIVIASFTDTTNKYNVPSDMTAKLTIYDASVYYDVVFNIDGETVDSRSVKAGTIITDLPTIPNRNGYSSSWNYDGNPIIGNTMITAVYNVEVYQLEYNLYGGTNSVDNPVSYTVENEVVFKNPSQEGCEFIGWYTDENYNNQITSTEGYYENLVLYAKWQRSVYSIEYVLNGGTNETDAPVSFDAGITLTLPTATRMGYKFDGWSMNPSMGNLPDGTGITTTEGIYESITLYAYWSPITYYISYIDGSINDELQPRTYTVENDVVIAEGAMVGYEFIGWTSDDLGITTPQKTITISANTVAKNLVIKGHFSTEAIVYNITYELNGGTTTEILEPTYTKDEVYTFPKLTKTNYDFAGWYLVDDNDEILVEIKDTSSVASNIKIRAVFNERIHDITYINRSSEADAINPNSTITSFKESEPYTFQDASADGFTFVGWYSDYECTNLITSTEGITTDLVIYSVFTPNVYNITYYGCEEAVNNNSSTFAYGDIIIFSNPEKDGYKFVGWTSSELEITTPTVSLRIVADIASNISFTANWEIQIYTVTYIDEETTTDTFSVVDYDMKTYVSPYAGYAFEGWYTEQLGQGIKVETLQGVYNDITLYAYVPTIKYVITYNLDGGVNSSSNPSYYTIENDDFTILNPTKEGYEFVGWTIDYSAFDIDEKYFNPTIKSEWMSNMILAANWVQSVNNIYYDFDCYEDISAIFEDTSVYKDGEIITFPTPSLNYYIFEGWYSDPEYTNQIYNTEGLTGDIYVYGKFIALEYTITYINSFDNSTYDDNEELIYIYTYGDGCIEIVYTPELDGYTFVSYEYDGNIYSEANEDGVYLYIDFNSDGLPGDIEIIINWEED